MASDDLTQTQGFVAADAKFRALVEVERFTAITVRPIVAQAALNGGELERTYFGYLLRALAWLRSLNKLNHPGDFQAVAAGARSLFEITIDLTLLLHDPDCPIAKLLAWELSTRHKHAEERLKIMSDWTDAERHESLVSGYERFVTEHTQGVAEARSTWWPKHRGKHPSRWTGQTLREDAKRCDVLTGAVSAGDFYRLRFAKLCWSTHGSGFVDTRFLSGEHFPALIAESLNDAVALALAINEIVLRALNRYDAAAADSFKVLETRIQRAYALALLHRPST